MLLSEADLKRFAPATPGRVLAPLVAALNRHLPSIGISGRGPRLFHFLAQHAYESNSFSMTRENVSYSAGRIVEVFPYVSGPEAARIAHDGPALCERVYGLGHPKLARELGNLSRGDAYRYRGGGINQLTGGANYRSAGLGDDPDSISDPNVAVEAACFFWHTRNINAAADRDDLEAVTRKVNGGVNGLSGRRVWLDKARRVFAGESDPTPVPSPAPETVAAAQGKLKKLGWSPGAVDGVHGHLSRAATLSYQDTVGLPPTGDLDPATLESLAARDAPRPLADARADATVASLRGKSRTVDAADHGKGASIGASVLTAGVALGQTALDKLTSATNTLSSVKDAAGKLGDVQDAVSAWPSALAWAAAHWWVGVVFVVAAVGFLAFDNIQKLSVENVRDGSHL